MSTKPNMIKEITPLTPNDCFTIFSRVKTEFDFPLHFHEEYELNLILNASGAKRIVGDHISVIDDVELVLVGPNLPHVWLTHECKTEITEITIQWHKDLFDEKFLKRNQMSFIRQMFDKSLRGISFSKESVIAAVPRLQSLKNTNGFNSVLELLSILNDLSMSKSMSLLSDIGFINSNSLKYNSRRLEKAFDFMHTNYDKDISLKDLAKLTNMTDESFSRFIKKRTGNTFINSLNEIRLGHASRMLIDTTHTITEISYSCGFNNISNFNRLFKKKKHCTPKEFRENFSGNRIFV
ncbi:AraC family transcriptional regulator [Pedobacter xixiisoli]|uniref:AraC-type DNA-binding protein n=1 Tax=Pedobacter xixiisoli TaxID=1476464 RepID=A0A285ZR11_9SPHI|nr:AraC family transcriptional regulator [Pedobacter xixiisoli]SOD12094.1 AraC-type DNA-binding protein [Pedobacter xixiisoli]